RPKQRDELAAPYSEGEIADNQCASIVRRLDVSETEKNVGVGHCPRRTPLALWQTRRHSVILVILNKPVRADIMRFIHAADIHLDSPLRGLGSYDDMPVDTLRGATRAAFTRLVEEAIALEVDFVVIAGDLYDGDWKDHNTGIYFARQMGRLRNAGIPVYVLHGNHDAESVMTRRLTLPDTVHVFRAGKPTTFVLSQLKVALHGQSFSHAAVTDNLAAGYPDPLPGHFNIGVLHTALEGYAEHAHYAPCTLEQLHARGYQYWALGHVHEYCVFPGTVPVVFPGNLQGRHIREQGARGAVLVSCSEGEVQLIERLEVDVVRWHRL